MWQISVNVAQARILCKIVPRLLRVVSFRSRAQLDEFINDNLHEERHITTSKAICKADIDCQFFSLMNILS